ncbi:MAG: capsular biosynthesis protein [Clostridium sp.]|uniref:YveK family protein n=1 Tax=Clostridium sp. TaxID=1506 RepID=UPI0025C2C748|nr:Wzz/FepE/Etk N-terminal domain-containing protein [Clostridium sp.]MBS4957081.1 capsular biosynthesis protein [Clostridium sp.]
MINILEYLSEIKKNCRNIAIITLSFILIATIYTTFFMNQDYEATVKVFIGKQKFKNTMQSYNNEEVTLYQRLITTYSEVIKSKKLINKSINESKINSLKEIDGKIEYGSVIGNLTVNPITDTQIIELKYTSKNPQQSYNLIYSMTENLIAYSKELYPTVNIKVLEQVNVNSSDLMSKKIMVMGIGFIGGLIVSIGAVVMMMYFNNTFKSKETLEEELGLAVLGTIPDIQDINV